MTTKGFAVDPEQHNVEYKTCSDGRLPKDFWQSVSAFSNTDGGKLYLGVNPNGNAVGLSNDELDKLQQDVASLCGTAFNMVVPVEIIVVRGCVVVEVPPSPAQVRPIYKKSLGINKGTYVRIGSTNHQANGDHIKRFAVAARGGAETLEYPSVPYQEVLDLKEFGNFVDELNEKKNNIYQRFELVEVLVKQRAIDRDGSVTMFGLLAFCKDFALQEIVAPTMNISVTQYPGVTKVNENDMAETFSDNREFNGAVTEQFTAAFAFIKTKLPIIGSVDSSGRRKEYFVIPEIALREALANAIAHRDYSSQSSRIQVDIYSDRLEIINPGVSLVPLDQLETSPSTTRNPLLMNYLKERGITDQKARGIRTIKLSIRKAGLIEPIFENVNQSFRVVLHSSAFLSAEDRQWLLGFVDYNLNERQRSALVHVRNNHTGISNGEYRSLNSMASVSDDKRANRELKALVQEGILEVVGEKRTRRYVLSEGHR